MNQELSTKNQANNTAELILRVEEVVTDVILFCGKEEIGRIRIEPNRELLEKLLPAIDGLLLEHRLVPSDIGDIHVESELPDGYSSRRIAETIANVWKGSWEKENRAAHISHANASGKKGF